MGDCRRCAWRLHQRNRFRETKTSVGIRPPTFDSLPKEKPNNNVELKKKEATINQSVDDRDSWINDARAVDL
jgi:hypothetical protein